MIPSPRTRTSPQRLLSGYAVGAFGFVVVVLGGWWFTLALGVMVHLGLLEYFRLARFKGIRPASKTTLVLVQLLLITTQWAHGGDAQALGFSADLAAAVLPLSGAAICGWLLLQPLTGSIADIASSIFALFYLGFLPSYWIRLRDLTDPALAPRLSALTQAWPHLSSGMVLMLMACFLIVATDIGSYVIGRRYGRQPLSPISPGKTIEGALGGVACAALLGGAFAEVLGWNWGWAVGALLGVVVALFALVGDLTESMMKRDAGVKDSGDLLPGHGGILDRIDSYLFTPAVFFTVVTLLLPLIR
ncbi:MAG: phosphatidate cytidylyltransferase [Vulcanococcus sp.]|uniref:phosphatidate cytidylyltransferase n=1 Tax=Vulcanococcus sp. TaxID=2856995 RepID=UPI0025CF1130|nr:phosphatidate cytidylyltransferase [Vulcanococcus sp.]MBW0166176.1 phosphatidate cytidylyltransferase [Vulcanococcus sp.]MBW0174691.1 phosphatidate cytidylyltransferase [Vulcanococcus sp.]MBW0179602.1 phosphatidate cytidylyltransferase [Vulcanococcus sp.]